MLPLWTNGNTLGDSGIVHQITAGGVQQYFIGGPPFSGGTIPVQFGISAQPYNQQDGFPPVALMLKGVENGSYLFRAQGADGVTRFWILNDGSAQFSSLSIDQGWVHSTYTGYVLSAGVTPAVDGTGSATFIAVYLYASGTITITGTPSVGRRLTFQVCQNSTGGWALTWPSNVKGGMVAGAAPNVCSMQEFIYRNSYWWATSPGVVAP